MEFSTELKKQIDHWIAKYPENQKQSAVLSALHLVQEASPDRCLSPEAIEAVARYLDMPVIAVQEVVSFYSLYDTAPVGRYKISVCSSISCKLKGSEKLIEHIQEKLRIDVNETTPDGRFTLKKVQCLAACINAPVCQINKDYEENVTVEKIDEWITNKH